jgi:hypothetical protein
MNVADLTLRFGDTRVAGRLYWPPQTESDPALMLLLARDEGLGRGLCWAARAVVLALSSHGALEALGWAVDHAPELGARSDDLLIAGGADAALLAVSSHRAAWPPVRRQVLIHPVFSTANPMPAELSGLPPATVVAGGDDDGSAYAERLREEGIEVELLPGPALTALAGSLRSSDAH